MDFFIVGAMVCVFCLGYVVASWPPRTGGARVCETPDEDPRDGWTPADGAGYIPTEEREKTRSCDRCGQSSRRSICRDCRREADTVQRKRP